MQNVEVARTDKTSLYDSPRSGGGAAGESPQARRERLAGLWGVAAACAALPTIPPVVYSAATDGWAAVRWLVVAFAAGVLLAWLYWSAYRARGLAVYGALGWLAATAHGCYGQHWPGWTQGLPLGLMVGGLAKARQLFGGRPSEENLTLLAALLAGGGVVAGLLRLGEPLPAGGWWLLLLAGSATAVLGRRLFRPALAVSCEPLLWLMYDVRTRGTGLQGVPPHGPCIVIANHACWMDPFFLEKILPRPTTPMMTSRFYDLPVIRHFMRRFGVIRVPENKLKKETPEIDAAIAALRRGECLVIFPEGYLRRRDDMPLRRFGRGVWHILSACPDTPVLACWIEGNWGSFTSHRHGPPLRNKPLDIRRPIRIAVVGPVVVPAAILADHWRTRAFLMNLVGQARGQIEGLEPLPPLPLDAVAAAACDDGDDPTEDAPSPDAATEPNRNAASG